MRFQHNKEGDLRTKNGFLFFPKTIGNETRWLEYAVWEQRLGMTWYENLEWYDWRWLN